jgi:16S rRNA C967 or C1407 C5-methylase (RsmB/RsmF family)/NOL1/NOP2/fmu family ribosome biogenesis protein
MSSAIQFPSAFEIRMRQTLGPEWKDFERVHGDTPPTSIRFNPKKAAIEKKEAIIPWTTFGRYLPERPIFTLDPLFHAGTYYVQEASSMFLEQAFKQTVDLTSSLNVLDLCAAPGGKSTHILSLINNESLLVSNEVIRSRASILAENIVKWGYNNAVVTNNDPKDFQDIAGFFDVIVIDAPCSGEGLFRKDREAMEEWSPQNVDLCSSRQKRIVSDVWSSLKENGILIYCTCTYNESENEENLNWLQQEHAIEFLKLKLDEAWGIEEVTKGNMTGYRFFPHRTKGEGFFMSAMRKKETQSTFRFKIKKSLTIPSKKVEEVLRPWLTNDSEIKLFQYEDAVYFLPLIKKDEMEILREHLKIIHRGTTIATVKHDKFIPEHALAMSINLQQQNFKRLDVNYDEAIRYLRRDPLTIGEVSKGYHLITFNDVPLGWVNSLGNRFNTLYPLEWRIRMAPL